MNQCLLEESRAKQSWLLDQHASYLEVHGFGLEDVFVHRVNFKGGITSPPDRPGHGVEFDWEALEACLQ